MTTDVAPPPVKRRWKRRVIVGGVLLLLAALLAFWWIVVSPHWRLAAIVAELDATDPNWRLAEIEARRAAVPDHENSALFMLALAKKAGSFEVYDGFGVYEKIFKAERPPPVQLNAQQVRYLQKHFAKLGPVLHEARKLKDMPRGRFPIEYHENGIDTHLECAIARSFIDLFMHDGFLLAHEGKIDEALDSALCCLNCGRSVGDEPLLSSFLIRFALTLFVYHGVERALAQGEASDRALEKLQMELHAENQQHRFPAALRGERAAIHELCKSIQKGTTDPHKLRRLPAKGKMSFVEWLREKVPHDVVQGHADLLREMTLSLEASKAPLHELIPRMDAREKEFAARANYFAVQFATTTKKVTQVEVRCHVYLRCTYTALACERYRLKHKDWPASLDALVEAKLLDAVPDDPYDGKPLRYLRTKEGATVYSVGYDLADNKGKIDSNVPFFTPGYDLGVRLWDVPQRRQPPLPLVPLAREDE
jgi:hypothetical protein